MRILLTGASSFTGYWFVRELVNAGHEVMSTFTRGALEEYEGLRHYRVARLTELCDSTFSCQFGDDRFLGQIQRFRPDVLCHHAADATNYKSPDFDYTHALGRNTFNLPQVLQQLKAVDCSRVVLTGTFFEEGEGAGSEPMLSFSSYGLSKALTDRVFRHFAQKIGISLAKFVIPNPFGPLEEPRFTAYLMQRWSEREVAHVRTPAYVRDNIHVSLLSKAYRAFVEGVAAEVGFMKTNPSGYIESQGAFAERFAHEMRKRHPWPCELVLAEQQAFDEPLVRMNTTTLNGAVLGWDEEGAWDEIAEYYHQHLGIAE